MEIPNPNPNPVILSVRVGNSYLFSHAGCAQKFKFTVQQFLSATFALLILTVVPYFSIYVLFAQICVSRWTGFVHSELYNS